MIEGPWSTSEIKILRREAHKGALHVAEATGRSICSVRSQAHRLRISLRKRGCARGTLLGQPRGASWRVKGRLLRERIIAAGYDASELEEMIRRDNDPETGLCPRCAKRKVSVRSTGLCEPCHWRGLEQAMREKDEAVEGRRGYWRERERRKRRVFCEVCGDEYSPRLDSEGRKSDRNVCPDCR